MKKLISYTNKRIAEWYLNAKTDYGVIGSGKVRYEKNKVIIDFIEDGKKFTWSMVFYPECLIEQDIDWVFNCWAESLPQEEATATVKQTGFMATNILNGNTPVNEYVPTSVDEAKKKNNRLISIDGQYRTVITANGTGITIKGERNWKHWIEKNEYVTDF